MDTERAISIKALLTDLLLHIHAQLDAIDNQFKNGNVSITDFTRPSPSSRPCCKKSVNPIPQFNDSCIAFDS